MLDALDQLGVVGTRVIGASKDDLIKTLRRPASRCSPSSHEAGDALAPGPRPGGQLPVPQGGRRGRQGRLRQRLDPGRDQPRDPDPRRGARPDPAIERPGPGPGAHRRAEVPAERRPDQQGLPEVLDDLDLLQEAEEGTAGSRRTRTTRSARSVNAVPDGAGAAGPPGPPGPARAAELQRRADQRPRRRRRTPARRCTEGPRHDSAASRSGSRRSSCSARSASSTSPRTYLGFVDRVLGRGSPCTPTLPDLRRPLRGQRGDLPRRQDRQGRRDGRRPATGVAARPGARGRHRAPAGLRRCSCTTSRRWGSSTSTSSRQTTRARTPATGDTIDGTADVAAGRRGRPAGRARPVRRLGRQGEPRRSPSASSGRCSTTPASRCSTSSTTAASSSTRPPPTRTRRSACSSNGLTVLRTQRDNGENIRSLLPRPAA